MPTEELFGNYHSFLSRQADPSTVIDAQGGDSLMLILDDTDGAETVRPHQGNLHFGDAGGIIAVELDAGNKVTDGDFDPVKEQDPSAVPLNVEEPTADSFTATDDLWL